jgi:hypothetical protein
MGYKDKRYGVTWRTKSANNPTTVWFNAPNERRAFIAKLLSNKIVLKDSIEISSKNVDENDF